MIGLVFLVLHLVVAWRSVDLPTFPVALVNGIAGIWSIGVLSNFQRHEPVPVWAAVLAPATSVVALVLGAYAIFA